MTEKEEEWEEEDTSTSFPRCPYCGVVVDSCWTDEGIGRHMRQHWWGERKNIFLKPEYGADENDHAPGYVEAYKDEYPDEFEEESDD